MVKGKYLFIIYALALLSYPIFAQGQETGEDTIRIRTRVVFIDTLVKDKKTGLLVADLARENFEVLADGKPRTLSYFSREGSERRRPLALLLTLDLQPYDAEKYLRRSDVLDSLTTALKRLAPEDEVSIMAWLGSKGEGLRKLTDFSRDHEKMSEALASVPKLVVARAAPVGYSEYLIAVHDKSEIAAKEHPNSEVLVVSITTSVAPLAYNVRDEMAAKMIRANIVFNPLIVDLAMKYVLMRPLLESSGRLAKDDIYGAAQHIAEQTGGETIHVHSPKDYGAALENFIAGQAARYNLGFTLNDNERDDERMHKLEVKVKARDSRGRERKLIIRARRGYYIPKTDSISVVK
ncbi:MAG: VWA domain-containing protein [Acidobacteriota bacterium]|nr:VWA domain-containing protein [Acidobacteriota bacterium]